MTQETKKGWRAVLLYLAGRAPGWASAADVAEALKISPGAAWMLLERSRLFSNLRSQKEGGKRYYQITKKGQKLVDSGFKRGKA